MKIKKSVDTKVRSFNIEESNFKKLTELAEREGVNSNSLIVNKLIEEYKFISFDVTKELEDVNKQIALEKAAYQGRIQKLEQQKEELERIGKNKKMVDRAMSAKKEEYIGKLVAAFKRKAAWEGIDLIAKEGQRLTGIDARELITEAVKEQ